MATETIRRVAEATQETQYDYKSFDLVFSKFSASYNERLQPLFEGASRKTLENGFLGLSPHASIEQMASRLRDATGLLGDEPSGWGEEHQEGAEIRDAILISARYLAWHANIGAMTQEYLDRVEILEERGELANLATRNPERIRAEVKKARTLMVAQNHALRDYFDSGLAHLLGNDSPAKMDKLLGHVPLMSHNTRARTVNGISLEIAAKRHIQYLVRAGGEIVAAVNYGSGEMDAKGGDIIVVLGDRVILIDVKASMPKKFYEGANGDSSPADYEKGYKLVDEKESGKEFVVWAFDTSPVSKESFRLTDARFAHNLGRVLLPA